MNTKIDTQHTSIRVTDSNSKVSFHGPRKIEALTDGINYAWITLESDMDTLTIHLTPESIPQLKKAVRQIEQFYMKEAV